MPKVDIRNLEAVDLTQMTIEESSEGLSFGRRFKVTSDSTTSDPLLFRDIFDDVKKAAEKANTEHDLQKLKAVIVVLDKLDTVDIAANDEYKEKDYLYRFMTFLSRLFSFGSHSDRISDLRKYVTDQLDILDPNHTLDTLNLDERFDALKALPDSPSKQASLTALAKEYFDNENYDQCLEVFKESPPSLDGELIVVKLARVLIKNEKSESALAAIALIKDDMARNLTLPDIASLYIKNEAYEEAIEILKPLASASSSWQISRDLHLAIIADKYYDKGEYEKGIETIKLVTCLLGLKDDFIEKTLNR